MINLRDYPRLECLTRTSSGLRYALDIVLGLYQEKKRISGRLVIEHCMETSEIVSCFTTDVSILIAALYHDLSEDFNLSFQDVREISPYEGKKIAGMVMTLSKSRELKRKEEREQEYMTRLYKAIHGGNEIIGLIKLADRMSNLSDLQFLPSQRRRDIALQTLNFYIPIANKLNLKNVANRMTGLSLPYIGSQDTDTEA